MEDPVYSRVKVYFVPPIAFVPYDRTTHMKESLQREITALLREWRNLDPMIALVPWNENDTVHPLTQGTPAVVPVHWNVAPFYFHGLNYAGNELWFHMRVKHSIRMDNLLQGNLPLTLRLLSD